MTSPFTKTQCAAKIRSPMPVLVLRFNRMFYRETGSKSKKKSSTQKGAAYIPTGICYLLLN